MGSGKKRPTKVERFMVKHGACDRALVTYAHIQTLKGAYEKMSSGDSRWLELEIETHLPGARQRYSRVMDNLFHLQDSNPPWDVVRPILVEAKMIGPRSR